MPVCSKCGKTLVCPDENKSGHGALAGLDLAASCPKASIWVMVKDDDRKAVEGVDVKVTGAPTETAVTDKNGFAAFDPLEEQEYTAELTLSSDLQKHFEEPDPASKSATASEGIAKRINFELKRLETFLKVKIEEKDWKQGMPKLPKVAVKVKDLEENEVEEDCDGEGLAEFKMKSRPGKCPILEISADGDDLFEVLEVTVV